MVIAHRPTGAPVNALFSFGTTEDVERLIATIADPVWEPLGGSDSNYGPVNLGSDAADALMEKITNAMDSHIELAVQLSGQTEFESPRTAVQALFEVPGGHVERIPTTERRRELAALITVTMREGDREDEPTIVIEDSGIGQHPDEFPNTLVSLNRKNKRDKFYLIGAYGWGGSAALAFCPYVVFVSRRNPTLAATEGRRDEVGWTIIRFNDLAHERTSKTGVYEYLCVRSKEGTSLIPRFDANELPSNRRDWSGTSCTLVDYQIGRPTARAAAFLGAKSLLFVSNALLFDPVMPFLVREERPKFVRSNPTNAAGVPVVGNAARLAQLVARRMRREQDTDEGEEDEETKAVREAGVVYDRTFHARLTTGGKLTVRYWVMGQSGKYKKDWEPVRSYVPPEQAMTVAHNGQRHAAYGRELFDKIGYTSLSKALVVYVDCDELDWTEKRQLFSTTRDRLKTTSIAQELRDEFTTALRQDDWLQREDQQRKQRALSQQSKEQAERIRRMLEKAIAAYREGNVDVYKKTWSTNPDLPLFGDQRLLEQPPRPITVPDPEPEVSPMDYSGEPTFVRVLNAPVRVPAGGRAVVRIRIDAPDDYLSPGGGGSFVPLVTKGVEAFRVEGWSSLRNGIMRVTVSAKDASPGDRGRVVFTVIRGEALPISDALDLEASEPPQKRVKPAGKQQGKVQSPPVMACHREQWDAFGFDETTVAKLVPDPKDPSLFTIWVNWDYHLLDDKLLWEKKFDEALAEGFKERFIAAMGFLVWLQRQDEAETSDAELRRAARLHLFSSFIEV